MILVFKTNVTSLQTVTELTQRLNKLLFPASWNFDLDDCDRILRVEGKMVMPSDIIALLAKEGFACEELD